jgi:hypothetical protein
MGSPTPDLLVRARRFTIAFACLAVIGLAIGVALPFVLPGPKPLTIAIGSCCFVAILILGSRFLRRRIVGGPPPGP